MTPFTRDLALKLRLARVRTGLRQREAADLVGVSVGYLSHFESGFRTDRIRVGFLVDLLPHYGLTVEEFFAWKLTKADRDEVGAEITGTSHIAMEVLR